jgi:hypothetical protein
MLTTRIYLAAMSRADIGQEQLRDAPNFYFYVDEFQSFANATFANILSEARKYKLNLTIAHQYIEQMEEEVRDAVFGNVGTTIAFRVGPFDAEVLETVFSPKFLAPDIVNLGFAQIYLSLMIDGIGSQPFSATTLPPIKPASISAKEMIIERSRVQFANKRAAVEDAIFAWHGQHDMVKNPPPKVAGTPEVKKPPYEKRDGAPANASAREVTLENAPKRVDYKKEGDRRAEVRPAVPQSVKVFAPKNEYVKTEQQAPSKPAPSAATAYTPKPQPTAPTVEAQAKAVSDRNTTPFVPPYKKGDVSAPKSGKNLEDLRAVLRTLSANETAKTVLKTDDASGTILSQKKDSAPLVSPLRASLAAVINETTKTAHSTVAVATRVEPVGVENVTDEQNVEKPVSHAFTPRAIFEKEILAEDPLSPKKLERMMRTTGSDSTPLG